MIFEDKFIAINDVLKAEFDLLFDKALKSQQQPNDLWLLEQNAGYRNNFQELGLKMPYCIGSFDEGHSEDTQTIFIDEYRNTYIANYSYSNYLKEIRWTEENSQKVNSFKEMESISVQIEMLIYLKFWEADLIIKKLNHFVSILNGEAFDWKFKIPKNSAGARQKIIRERIRDNLKNISPILYKTFDSTYKTQIRNAIAHSNYAILDRSIHLHNFKEDQYSTIEILTFDEWIDIFHNTLALHNQYIALNNKINNYYGNLVKSSSNLLTVNFPTSNGNNTAISFEYDPIFGSWA
ncbi:hypothetical protein EON73_04340 [bacterium]|nr:MAG: hypothetical protein EON73_04340 [bacterium]